MPGVFKWNCTSPTFNLVYQSRFFPCQSRGFVLSIAKALQVLISFFRSGPTV